MSEQTDFQDFIENHGPEIAKAAELCARVIPDNPVTARRACRELASSYSRCLSLFADVEAHLSRAIFEAWSSAPSGTVPQREAFVAAETSEEQRLRDKLAAICISTHEQINVAKRIMTAHEKEYRNAALGT